MRTILIDREPVELYKILKFEGLASSGAEAKQIIASGLVSVNSEVETRKSRKMRAGDKLQLFDEILTLALNSPSESK